MHTLARYSRLAPGPFALRGGPLLSDERHAAASLMYTIACSCHPLMS